VHKGLCREDPWIESGVCLRTSILSFSTKKTFPLNASCLLERRCCLVKLWSHSNEVSLELFENTRLNVLRAVVFQQQAGLLEINLSLENNPMGGSNFTPGA
jgi:hypothetical protein